VELDAVHGRAEWWGRPFMPTGIQHMELKVEVYW